MACAYPIALGAINMSPKSANTLLNGPMDPTHLLNVRRGILVSSYARLAPEWRGQGTAAVMQAVHAAYVHSYASDPLVRFAPVEGRNDVYSGAQLLQLRQVVGTAYTHIAYHVVGDRLYLFCCIDNLLKGAATQAIENLNHWLGLPSETGLAHTEALI